MMSNESNQYVKFRDIVHSVVREEIGPRSDAILNKYINSFEDYLKNEVLDDNALDLDINKNEVSAYKTAIAGFWDDYKQFEKRGKGNPFVGKSKVEKSSKLRSLFKKLGAITTAIALPLGAGVATYIYNHKTFNKNDAMNLYSQEHVHKEVNGTISQSGTFQSGQLNYTGNIASENVSLNYSGSLFGEVNAQLENATLDAILDANMTAELNATLEQTKVEGNISLYVENANITGTYNGTIQYANGNVSENGTINLTNYTGWLKGNFNGTVKGKVIGKINGEVNGKVNGNIHGKVKGKVNGTEKGNIRGSIYGAVNGNIEKIVMNGTLDGNVSYVIDGNQLIAEPLAPFYALLALVGGVAGYTFIGNGDKELLDNYKRDLDRLNLMLISSRNALINNKLDETNNNLKNATDLLTRLTNANAKVSKKFYETTLKLQEDLASLSEAAEVMINMKKNGYVVSAEDIKPLYEKLDEINKKLSGQTEPAPVDLNNSDLEEISTVVKDVMSDVGQQHNIQENSTQDTQSDSLDSTVNSIKKPIIYKKIPVNKKDGSEGDSQ